MYRAPTGWGALGWLPRWAWIRCGLSVATWEVTASQGESKLGAIAPNLDYLFVAGS